MGTRELTKARMKAARKQQLGSKEQKEKRIARIEDHHHNTQAASSIWLYVNLHTG